MMSLFTTRKPEVRYHPRAATSELPENQHWFSAYIQTETTKPIYSVGTKVFEWLDPDGKAHAILCAPPAILGLWARLKMRIISLKGTMIPLSLISQAGEIINVNSTVWHQDHGHDRIFLHIDQAPRDVTEDSATGRVTKVSYTSQNIDMTVGCLPGHRTPAWMTFKEPPTLGDTVFVTEFTIGADAYRGSVLVEAKQLTRPRIVGIVDEAYKRSEAPPPGTIDEAWKVVRERVPFVYCVARPWSAKV